jgi:hypothetical protein
MSDPLSIFRNAVRDASPGPLIEDEATIFAADGSGYQVLRPDEYWGANDDEIPPDVQARLDANAQHIINADRLARFIASEEAPTVIADAVETVMFALALVRRLEGNTRDASQEVARAILTELANRALPQEAKRTNPPVDDTPKSKTDFLDRRRP